MAARVVVSVHDVARAHAAEVAWLLAELDRAGARPRVLKVVPGDRGEAIEDDPRLVDLLRAEAAAGSQVVLHGLTHRRDGPWRGPLGARLRARLFAPADAEFAGLDELEMERRLVEGRRRLAELGLPVDTFCAPAWIAPPALTDVLSALGFRALVRIASVEDLPERRRTWTPWSGYMGAGGWHEQLVAVGSGACRLVEPAFSVTKVFLHPQDARSSPFCRRVLRRLPGVLARRRPVTYADVHAA